MVTVRPPSPFDADTVVLDPGDALFRVHSNKRAGNVFNPGNSGNTRFAFFGDPVVPILYAADTQDAAICETLLHSVPVTGGVLRTDQYETTVTSRLLLRRPVRLASLLGLGLRRLGVEARDVTGTDADRYAETVLWAEAAHKAGFEGVAYMSRRCNSDHAFAFFGDRVTENDFDIASDYGRAFAFGSDRDWLIDFCAPLNVDVLI